MFSVFQKKIRKKNFNQTFQIKVIGKLLCPRFIDNKYRQVKCTFFTEWHFFLLFLNKNVYFFNSVYISWHFIVIIHITSHDASENKMKIMIFSRYSVSLTLLVIVNSWHGKHVGSKKTRMNCRKKTSDFNFNNVVLQCSEIFLSFRFFWQKFTILFFCYQCDHILCFSCTFCLPPIASTAFFRHRRRRLIHFFKKKTKRQIVKWMKGEVV